jgi:hypothetical protein
MYLFAWTIVKRKGKKSRKNDFALVLLYDNEGLYCKKEEIFINRILFE